MHFSVSGLKIALVPTDDRMVLHELAGGYERESLKAWAAIVRPAKVALDIGAYTGAYSIIAAMRGARAIALEPMPANHWRIGVNAQQNKVSVKVLPFAASDKLGQAILHYNPNVPLTTGASLEPGVAMHTADIAVKCVTIDWLALTDVAAIKIDVERHEPAVLRGAMQTIERDRPQMLIETLDDDMRAQVLKLLPSYDVAAVLDVRNTLFVPK
jgi:FkbM family methyltransferase